MFQSRARSGRRWIGSIPVSFGIGTLAGLWRVGVVFHDEAKVAGTRGDIARGTGTGKEERRGERANHARCSRWPASGSGRDVGTRTPWRSGRGSRGGRGRHVVYSTGERSRQGVL